MSVCSILSLLDDKIITHPFSFDSCTLLSPWPPRSSEPPFPLWNKIRLSLSVTSCLWVTAKSTLFSVREDGKKHVGSCYPLVIDTKWMETFFSFFFATWPFTCASELWSEEVADGSSLDNIQVMNCVYGEEVFDHLWQKHISFYKA